MNVENNVCVLCGEDVVGWGNNAQPLALGRCCDKCNKKVVAEMKKNVIAAKKNS